MEHLQASHNLQPVPRWRPLLLLANPGNQAKSPMQKGKRWAPITLKIGGKKGEGRYLMASYLSSGNAQGLIKTGEAQGPLACLATTSKIAHNLSPRDPDHN